MESRAVDKDGVNYKLFVDSFDCFWLQREKITNLYIDPTEDIRGVYCHDNLLTILKIPASVKEVWCQRNNLTSLELPDTLTHLSCDKELFDYDECTTQNVNIMY